MKPFHTLKDARSLIFTPKRYNEHPRPSMRESSPWKPPLHFPAKIVAKLRYSCAQRNLAAHQVLFDIMQSTTINVLSFY